VRSTCARIAGTAAWIAAVSICPGAQAQAITSVAAEQSEFVVSLSDGRTLRSADLVGAELTIDEGGTPLVIRIDAVAKDPKSAATLHTVSVRDASGAFTTPYCEADADGRRAAFPLAGRSRVDGLLLSDASRFELVCTSGAQGKCVRLGYAPWQGLDTFNACVRMIRADYCGDGTSTTRDGTQIDVYDDRDEQSAAADTSFRFEAGWTPEGAVCVRHPRIPENITLEKIASSCKRLAGKTGDACSEDAARKAGALVYNRSR
jgi:hypothetical protein